MSNKFSCFSKKKWKHKEQKRNNNILVIFEKLSFNLAFTTGKYILSNYVLYFSKKKGKKIENRKQKRFSNRSKICVPWLWSRSLDSFLNMHINEYKKPALEFGPIDSKQNHILIKIQKTAMHFFFYSGYSMLYAIFPSFFLVFFSFYLSLFLCFYRL